MKLRILSAMLVFVPLSLEAKWDVYGTEDGPDADTAGDLQVGSTVEFTTFDSKDGSIPESNFAGITTLNGELNEEAAWWVANNSTAPWDEFVAYPNSETQPSMVLTGDVQQGDTIMVGLSFNYEMVQYTSEFRMANNPFGAGAEFYFGVNNLGGTDVFVKDGNGDPIIDNDNGNITDVQNLTYKGSSSGLVSQGLDGGTHHPDFANADQFEWVHFETTNTNYGDAANDDIIFEIKEGKNANNVLALTEWVLFIVLDADTEFPNVTGDGLWDSDPTAFAGQHPDRIDDIVFSWTVDAKSGYTLDEFGNPVVNPSYDPEGGDVFSPPDPEIIPEPSSVLLLACGVSMFLCRRNRKAAHPALVKS